MFVAEVILLLILDLVQGRYGLRLGHAKDGWD